MRFARGLRAAHSKTIKTPTVNLELSFADGPILASERTYRRKAIAQSVESPAWGSPMGAPMAPSQRLGFANTRMAKGPRSDLGPEPDQVRTRSSPLISRVSDDRGGVEPGDKRTAESHRW